MTTLNIIPQMKRLRAEIAEYSLREERQRSELLARKLRELGLNPDEI